MKRKQDWKSVLTNIRERRSVFPPAFAGKEVPRKEIEMILEAANWAPSHKLTQPWRFVVIRGESRRGLASRLLDHYDLSTPKERILEKKRAKIVSNPVKSSAVIAIVLYRDVDQLVPEWEEVAATSCAVQNLWLAATALGIVGYWSSPTDLDHLTDFLGLDKYERCLGLFYLGYSDKTATAPTRDPWQQKVRWME